MPERLKNRLEGATNQQHFIAAAVLAWGVPAAGRYESRGIGMKVLKFLIFLLVLAVVAGAGVVGLGVWYFDRDLPDYQQLADYQPPIVTRVHAGDGRLMAEYANERRVFVPIAAIPPRVIDAFLAAEDKNFYSHPG